MKLGPFILFISCFIGSGSLFAQIVPAHKTGTTDKTDIIAFYRQITGLKEYADERSKIPALQKLNKEKVKIKAIVDTSNNTSEDEDEVKPVKLSGYIRLEIGENSVDLYELTYDRVKKKITAVVPTGDTLENGMVGKAVVTKRKNPGKAATSKSEDEEDDEDERPVKKIEKNKGDDD